MGGNTVLIRNWLYLLFSDLSQAIINFFIFMLLAVKLTPEGYGEFNVILAIVSIFTVVSNNFSANHVITREITLHPNGSYNIFKNAALIRLFSLFISIIAVIIYTTIKNENSSVTIFSTILVLANMLWDFSESIAFGKFITKFTTIFNIAFSLIWLIVVLCLPDKLMNVRLVLILYSLIYIVRGSSYLFTIKQKYIKREDSIYVLGFKSILLMSFPYLWMRLFGALTDQIPVLFLNKYSGPEQVGFFSVGFRLIIPISLTIQTALRAVFPFLTKLYSENKEDFSRKLATAFSFIFILGTIIAVVMSLFSKYWIPFLLGDSYIHSIETFNILAWFGVGICFDLFLSTILSSTYRQNTLAIITTIDCLISLPIYFFGAQYGALGLSYAKLCALAITLSYHIIVAKKLLHIDIFNQNFFYSVIFYALMMSFSIFITNFYYKILLIILVFTIYMIPSKLPLRVCFNQLASFLIKNKKQ